ncbi:MAG: hypothetical protein WAL90_10165, partial [Desulfobacterales bacterium]
ARPHKNFVTLKINLDSSMNIPLACGKFSRKNHAKRFHHDKQDKNRPRMLVVVGLYTRACRREIISLKTN